MDFRRCQAPRHALPRPAPGGRSVLGLLALVGLGGGAVVQVASLAEDRHPAALRTVASTAQLAGPPPAIPLDDWGGALLTEAPIDAAPVRTDAAPLASATLAGPPASIPTLTLGDYQRAAAREQGRSPGCHLPWPLLAGIGLIESNHGRHTQLLRGRAVVLGPVLDGTSFAAVPDSDHGALDGDPRWDRAVGPMQFLPSTWAGYAVDANGDGTADPQDGADAAAAAAAYLCASGRDLGRPADLRAAVFSYNHSSDYVRSVVTFMVGYADSAALVAEGQEALRGM